MSTRATADYGFTLPTVEQRQNEVNEIVRLTQYTYNDGGRASTPVFVYNDGGREAAGYEGKAGDCVCRAIAIAAHLPYQQVYERLAEGNASQRKSKRSPRQRTRSADNGINATRKWFKDYMVELGFTWAPTMQIGAGCTTHLKADELPSGHLVVCVSKHFTAVINGVIQDTHDCSRDGTRCVYGYYTNNGPTK